MFDALVDRAIEFVIGKGAVGFRFFAGGDFEMVVKFDGGKTKEFAVGFDAAFDVGFKIICCRDSTRFQRAGKCAGQSTG